MGTPGGVRGKDPVMVDRVAARRRDQGGELLHQLVGPEEDVRRAVAVRGREADGVAAVGKAMEAILRERRAVDVPAQAFQGGAVRGGDADTRVEVVPPGRCGPAASGDLARRGAPVTLDGTAAAGAGGSECACPC